MLRKGASSHRTKSSKRNTKHKSKVKSETKNRRNKNSPMTKNKLIIYKKMKPIDLELLTN